jgi:predicted benzoate:H+ symporter BenE
MSEAGAYIIAAVCGCIVFALAVLLPTNILLFVIGIALWVNRGKKNNNNSDK